MDGPFCEAHAKDRFSNIFGSKYPTMLKSIGGRSMRIADKIEQLRKELRVKQRLFEGRQSLVLRN